jgi:uncharacterized protein
MPVTLEYGEIRRHLGLERYNLPANVHSFTVDGYRIIYDVNSGSIHLADQATWGLLHWLAEGRSDERERLEKVYGETVLNDVVAELRALKEDGTLFTGITVPVAADEPVLKAICLHVAHDCNVRCRYCFAATGHFGGSRQLMPFAVGKAALDFLLQESGTRRHLEVDFFGGEPLLNWNVVKELILYGKRTEGDYNKVFRFTLTTNAVLLNDAMTAFLNAHRVSLVLSLDGRQAVNDRMRVFPNGRGTYDRVVDRINRLVRSRAGENYYVRGTYTRENLDFSQDVLHMADQGWKHLSVEPVVADAAEEYAIRPQDLPAIDREYDSLTQAYLERRQAGNGFNFFHFNLDVLHGPCLPKRLSGCGAGCEYLAVAPDGDIYPCHQLVGRQGYRMGNVQSGRLAAGLPEKFQQVNIFTKKDCPDCWARLLCSGGCHANAVVLEGDLNRPYRIGCHITRKRLECALYLRVRELLEAQETKAQET